MAGRPERHLKDDGTALASLALALRELRQAAGSPSYREMARRAHRSPTTLSEAAGGSQLPTWDTVEAYVTACGDPVEGWYERWLAVRPAGTAEAPDPASPASLNLPAPPSSPALPALPAQPAPGATAENSEGRRELRTLRRRWWPVAAAAVAVVVLAHVVLLHDRLLPGNGTVVTKPADAPIASHRVRDGSDPEDTGCARLPGVQLLDTTEVDYAGAPVGMAQLKYSPECGAAWPRFEPFARGDLPKGVTVHVDVVRPDDENARFPFDAGYVGAVVFGNQALSTSRCVYAAVWVQRAGEDGPESRTHCFRGSTFVR